MYEPQRGYGLEMKGTKEEKKCSKGIYGFPLPQDSQETHLESIRSSVKSPKEIFVSGQ